MRIMRRVLFGLGAFLLIGIAAVAALLWWSLPSTQLNATIPGLSAPVRIGFDQYGVPRIQAATALDGAAALGFAHARDRMFQMEMTRRVASGRVSEIAGAATLQLDRTMRILGLRRRAEADLPGLASDTRAMLEAYARGVNAWIDLRGRFAAPEFIVLGPPEPWVPVDSLLWGKTMALYLSGNWRQELNRAALMRRLPPERVRALWPEQINTPAPDARLLDCLEHTRLAELVPRFPDPFTLPDSASNEWAVDGKHSGSGAPILAGDPHLGYSMPDIWYLARIETPQGVLAGATAPGVPFLILGHNGHIAWTFTTTGADTQDVFIETPAGDGQYQTPDGPRPYLQHSETVHIFGAADQTFEVRETRHGPILSDLDEPGGPILAVAMASLAVPDTASTGLLALNRATTVVQAAATVAQISAPVQNVLVADVNNIGRYTTGRIPIRRAGDGTVPTDGADGLHDWIGFADSERLPHEFNPASGHLVNANERTAAPDFPVFMGQDWFGDWRAQRIRTLLESRTIHNTASFAAMQTDSVSTFAQSVLPRLLRTVPADPASRTALANLRRWDGSMRTDWFQPLLFNAWMDHLEMAILARDQLQPFDAGVQSDMLARALGPAETTWCGPDCDALLTRTLAEAARDNDPETRWGDVHKAEFAHPILGRLPLIGRLFTWRIEQPGDDTTLFRGSTRPPDWSAIHGPGFRGIYDLGDLSNSLFAMAPGQSGHFLRNGAGDLMRYWRGGASIKLGPSAEAFETIELTPARNSN